MLGTPLRERRSLKRESGAHFQEDARAGLIALRQVESECRHGDGMLYQDRYLSTSMVMFLSTETTDFAVAERVRQAMAVRGYSIRRLADETSTPYRTLQNRLSGRQVIAVDALARIARALRVSADWLLFGRAAGLDQVILIEALDGLDEQGRMSLRQRAEWVADMYRSLYDDEFNVNVQVPASTSKRRGGRPPRRREPDDSTPMRPSKGAARRLGRTG